MRPYKVPETKTVWYKAFEKYYSEDVSLLAKCFTGKERKYCFYEPGPYGSYCQDITDDHLMLYYCIYPMYVNLRNSADGEKRALKFQEDVENAFLKMANSSDPLDFYQACAYIDEEGRLKEFDYYDLPFDIDFHETARVLDRRLRIMENALKEHCEGWFFSPKGHTWDIIVSFMSDDHFKKWL